jgi:hypothetical protein
MSRIIRPALPVASSLTDKRSTGAHPFTPRDILAVKGTLRTRPGS